jgi:hypothetical protein
MTKCDAHHTYVIRVCIMFCMKRLAPHVVLFLAAFILGMILAALVAAAFLIPDFPKGFS